MRPTLKALAEQQILLENQQRQIDAIARLAGVNLKPVKAEAKRRIAAMRRTADTENPAQPVPEPSTEAPAVTSDEALGEISTDAPGGGNTVDDVTDVGTTSETDVTPTATDDVTSVGTSMDETLTLEDQDVTKPVEGTTDARPTSETVTEGDVTYDDGVKTETFAPLEGDFANAQTVSSATPRAYASLRLARLRLKAGIEKGEDLTVAEAISRSAATDEAINAEIEVLTKVTAAKAKAAQAPANPGQQTPTRAVPSLATAASASPGVSQGSGVGGNVTAAVEDAIL